MWKGIERQDIKIWKGGEGWLEFLWRELCNDFYPWWQRTRGHFLSDPKPIEKNVNGNSQRSWHASPGAWKPQWSDIYLKLGNLQSRSLKLKLSAGASVNRRMPLESHYPLPLTEVKCEYFWWARERKKPDKGGKGYLGRKGWRCTMARLGVNREMICDQPEERHLPTSRPLKQLQTEPLYNNSYLGRAY